MIALAWIIFAAAVAALSIINFFLVRYYAHEKDSEWFPTIVAILALTLTLLCLFLIPIDIYAVSTGEADTMGSTIRTLYLVLYSLVLAFTFGLIPFACFYYEAYDPRATTLKRIWDGFKYTIGLLIIVVALLIGGIFIQNHDSFTNKGLPQEWVDQFGKILQGEYTIIFTVACLTLIGYVVWVTYTAFGLASFPISLIKGRKSLSEEEDDIKRNINTRHETLKRNQDPDIERLLRDDMRALNRQKDRLSSVNACFRKCFIFCRPFSVVFGALGYIFSLFLVLSLALTAIERLLHHIPCNATCGYILEYSSLNPIDKILSILADVFPIDYIIISFIILYFYGCTLSAITDIGIRLFCLKMFRFSKGATPPQGLMTASIILMLSIMALNNSFVTLAPNYAMYGSQTYKEINGTEIFSCSQTAPAGSGCKMTQIGNIVFSVNAGIGFFGMAFFVFQWIFIASFLLCTIIAICRAKKSNIEKRESDEEEDESVAAFAK